VHLATIFKQWGIPCDTVAHRGRKALSNDELVARAFAEGFRCLLTRDQLFGESASEAVAAGRTTTLSSVLKRARQDSARPSVMADLNPADAARADLGDSEGCPPPHLP
jgi:hypothetical protein